MDLDILLYGDLVCDEPDLVLPRPDLVRRAYMLGPIAELAPDVVHPVLGRTMGELWSAFDRDAHDMLPVEIGWRPRGETDGAQPAVQSPIRGSGRRPR